ncbi:MAG: HDOD domain-containing protein [Burkholderiaceae bacterium]|nr:HDOD domain-containing protein [Burkholderiaceae bacterium]
MDLKSLLDNPSKLPTIPKVTQQLIKSFSDDDISIDEIARQLTADPVLSAKLLRLANSAYFHVSRTIGTVDSALLMLGFVMVRNLALGNGMVAAFRNTPGMNLKQFWRYNLHTACASRWLAVTNGVNADLIFTLGLLHGIGQLQMHNGMPEQMLEIDKQMNVLEAGRAALERETLGFHYGDVSAELAKMWNFPEPLIAALRAIPAPLEAEEFSEAAAWVHMGAWRARTEALAMSDAEVLASYPAEVGKRLGLAPDWVPALAQEFYGIAAPAMPPLRDLAEGLDAMLS